MPVKPIDTEDLMKKTNVGVYEAIIIAAKRARQIHNDVKIELNQHLETLAQLTQTVETEDEMDVSANPDQLKISLEFEKRPKPTELAVQEFSEGRLEWRRREEEKPEPEQPSEEEEPESAA